MSKKLKSKHTSLKKYTNWDKLSCLSLYIFLSFWGNERRQKPIIPHLSFYTLLIIYQYKICCQNTNEMKLIFYKHTTGPHEQNQWFQSTVGTDCSKAQLCRWALIASYKMAGKKGWNPSSICPCSQFFSSTIFFCALSRWQTRLKFSQIIPMPHYTTIPLYLFILATCF